MRQELLDTKNWYEDYEPISMLLVNRIEKQIGKKFPMNYKILVEKFNAGTPKIADFDLKNYGGSGIGAFLSFKEERIDGNGKYDDSRFVKLFKKPPEFFPSGIIAFAETGGGDFICFDYRQDPDTDNPPIVYWDHEGDEGNDLYFLANNFDEFLDMLYEYKRP